MNIVLIGQGGHSKVIRDSILSNSEYKIVGYLDVKYKTITLKDNIYYAPMTFVEQILELYSEVRFVITVGDNRIRKTIAEKLMFPKEYYANIIHQSAIISPSSRIGFGNVIMANAVINADAQIGNHSIINTGAIVEHDNSIGDFVHISPNATSTGGVQIEEGVHIGAGATIIPGVHIGEWSIIGAGATVINDIPSNCTAVGIPAKAMKKIKVR